MPLCYIKDRKTFRTKHMAQCAYDMTLRSIYTNETTTITMPGTENQVAEGDFVFVDGYAGIVKEVSSGKSELTLTCTYIVTMLRRDLFPVVQSGTTEAFLKQQIDANFTNAADVVYKLPWLNVQALTSSAAAPTPELENGLWNIQAYVALVQRLQNVFTDFSVDGDTLVVSIGKRQPATHNVDLNMSQFETLEEVKNVTRVGRVSAMAEDTDAVTDWYKLTDGTITQTYTAANRFDGEWARISVAKAADVQNAVMAEFARNAYSHMVEFATNEKYQFYDNLYIRTEGGQVLESYISAVRKRSDDSRTIYKAGDRRILLSDILNQKINGG